MLLLAVGFGLLAIGAGEAWAQRLGARGLGVNDTLIPQLSTLGWDHINLTEVYGE